jgi:hypothetical protein
MKLEFTYLMEGEGGGAPRKSERCGGTFEQKRKTWSLIEISQRF